MIDVSAANREALLALLAALRARRAQGRTERAYRGERLPGGGAAGR